MSRVFRKSCGAVLGSQRESFHARLADRRAFIPPFARSSLFLIRLRGVPAKGKKFEPPCARLRITGTRRGSKRSVRCTRVSEAGTRTTTPGPAVFAPGASDTIVRASTSGKRTLNGFLRRLLAPVISMRESLDRRGRSGAETRESHVSREESTSGRKDGSASLCAVSRCSPSSGESPFRSMRKGWRGVAGGKNCSRARARPRFSALYFRAISGALL